MDKIGSKLLKELAWEIAAANLQTDVNAERKRPHKYKTTLAIAVISMITGAMLLSYIYDNQRLKASLVATNQLQDRFESVSLRRELPDLSGCQGLIIHLGSSVDCVQGPY